MIKQIVKTLPKLKDGERFVVSRSGHKGEFVHKCCDCGARHDVSVTVGTRNFVFRFWRIKNKRSK
jgi:hypothetical protein